MNRRNMLALKYTNPSASFGGTAELVWKRVK